jgi:hypothetical protein
MNILAMKKDKTIKKIRKIGIPGHKIKIKTDIIQPYTKIIDKICNFIG